MGTLWRNGIVDGIHKAFVVLVPAEVTARMKLPKNDVVIDGDILGNCPKHPYLLW
jgi:hypothetical protein